MYKMSINGVELTIEQSLTIICALESLSSSIKTGRYGEYKDGETVGLDQLPHIKEIKKIIYK